MPPPHHHLPCTCTKHATPRPYVGRARASQPTPHTPRQSRPRPPRALKTFQNTSSKQPELAQHLKHMLQLVVGCLPAPGSVAWCCSVQQQTISETLNSFGQPAPCRPRLPGYLGPHGRHHACMHLGQPRHAQPRTTCCRRPTQHMSDSLKPVQRAWKYASALPHCDMPKIAYYSCAVADGSGDPSKSTPPTSPLAPVTLLQKNVVSSTLTSPPFQIHRTESIVPCTLTPP